MSTEKEIDHDSTDEAVCPYCGHTHNDSHEWFGNESHYFAITVSCDKCSKQFTLDRDITVTYTTAKIEKP